MIYSIQSHDGEVHGYFKVPDTNPPLSSEEWAAEFRILLDDKPAIETIYTSSITSKDEVPEDFVVLKVNEIHIAPGDTHFDLGVIHFAANLILESHRLKQKESPLAMPVGLSL
jgi:hypothetical protein